VKSRNQIIAQVLRDALVQLPNERAQPYDDEPDYEEVIVATLMATLSDSEVSATFGRSRSNSPVAQYASAPTAR